MNTPNNKRKRDSIERIQKAFAELLVTRELNEISVTELCEMAKINRTTFYANYLDVFDLADKFRERLEDDVRELYREERETRRSSFDFLKLFREIRENQLFYTILFKLGTGNLSLREYDVAAANERYGGEYIDYHIEFFNAGLNAVLRKWLKGGCVEEPEEIEKIIVSEYKGKTDF